MRLGRRNELYLSDEIWFYLNLEAKRMVQHTDASVTLDQVAEGIIRHRLTTENPEWVVAYEEFCKAKADAQKSYREIETKALGVKPAIAEAA